MWIQIQSIAFTLHFHYERHCRRLQTHFIQSFEWDYYLDVVAIKYMKGTSCNNIKFCCFLMAGYMNRTREGNKTTTRPVCRAPVYYDLQSFNPHKLCIYALCQPWVVSLALGPWQGHSTKFTKPLSTSTTASHWTPNFISTWLDVLLLSTCGPQTVTGPLLKVCGPLSTTTSKNIYTVSMRWWTQRRANHGLFLTLWSVVWVLVVYMGCVYGLRNACILVVVVCGPHAATAFILKLMTCRS